MIKSFIERLRAERITSVDHIIDVIALIIILRLTCVIAKIEKLHLRLKEFRISQALIATSCTGCQSSTGISTTRYAFSSASVYTILLYHTFSNVDQCASVAVTLRARLQPAATSRLVYLRTNLTCTRTSLRPA